MNISSRLNSLGVTWFLGGSAALMVHDVDIVPHDLDIFIAGTSMGKVLSDFQISSFDKNENGNYQLFRSGIKIEFIEPVHIEILEKVNFQNMVIPVNSLKVELTYYRSRPGKEAIVKQIEDKLVSQL